MNRLFVYGTLKSDGAAHHILGEAKPLGSAATSMRYSLYHVGGWFPGMVEENSGSGVQGELYEVSEDCLRRTDRYESIDSGLFRRTEIELSDGSKVLAYLYAHPLLGARKLTDGFWKN